MNHAEIRTRFRHTIGTEKFQRFVAETHYANRLRFWQEQLWDPFALEHGLDLDFPTIQDCFAICQVHECELETDTVPVVYGTPVTPTQAELEVPNTLFPCARLIAGGGCVVGHQQSATVQFCPECRVAHDHWESQAFQRNIASPDSREIRLFLAAKASHFHADSDAERLFRYYKTWKPPRSANDPTVNDAVTQITELHSRLRDREMDAATELLNDARSIFSISHPDGDDAIILDHCKMHFIAADTIINS